MGHRYFLAVTLATVLAVSSTASYADNRQKEGVGTVVGGIVGALLGNKMGKKKNRKTATILGALIGAGIGNRIGASLDERDKQLHIQAIKASLNKGNVGQRSVWKNPNTNNQGKVTVVKAYKNNNHQSCKDMEAVITTNNGTTNKHTITGCQDQSGGWTLAG